MEVLWACELGDAGDLLAEVRRQRGLLEKEPDLLADVHRIAIQGLSVESVRALPNRASAASSMMDW